MLLGAGSSKAAFPHGDARGKIVPLMRDLAHVTGVDELLRLNGIREYPENIELVFQVLDVKGHCHVNESELSKIQEIETFTIRGHKLPGPMRQMLGLSMFGSSLQIAG